MKNLKRLIIGISALSLIFTSCEGPAGRDGLDGFDGFDGRDGIDGVDGRDGDSANETVIYELGGLTFNESNDFLINEPIPDDIIMDSSDIIMVFRLLSIDPTVGEIWEQLPQLYFLDNGTLQYNFNFSQDDLDFIIDADFDLATFNDPSFTDDQVFRIAVVPASDNTSAKLLSSKSTYAQIAEGAEIIRINL